MLTQTPTLTPTTNDYNSGHHPNLNLDPDSDYDPDYDHDHDSDADPGEHNQACGRTVWEGGGGGGCGRRRVWEEEGVEEEGVGGQVVMEVAAEAEELYTPHPKNIYMGRTYHTHLNVHGETMYTHNTTSHNSH
jgi:hypothetical protein